ncbi:helix-turn-helix domain-containing protein [uncultured Duncaniella sp.]|uniref:helix-turn-helix domain-containing protein n=1 Tax=uncultured Duncaniella sp. TaxID=2768039 RepID=UPI0025B6AE57|nr:helix-turn-helix domain-containing protein [uncultured Duncaniella sp.]
MDKLTGLLFHLKGTFTVEDAALYLGITPSHLYKLVRKYDIPHSRPTNGYSTPEFQTGGARF